MKLLNRNKKSTEEQTEKKKEEAGKLRKGLFKRKKKINSSKDEADIVMSASSTAGADQHKTTSDVLTPVGSTADVKSQGTNDCQLNVKSSESKAGAEVQTASRDEHNEVATTSNVSEINKPTDPPGSVDQNEREEAESPESPRPEAESPDSPKEDETNDTTAEEKETPEKPTDEQNEEDKEAVAAEGEDTEDAPETREMDVEEPEKAPSPVASVEENDGADDNDQPSEEGRDIPDDTAGEKQEATAEPLTGLLCGCI